MNYDIYRFGRIDSTNGYLMKLGDEGFPEGTVAVADEQTQGRGRFGRKWEAEPLSNLLFSLLLRPEFLKRDEMFILTFSAAVAVAEVLEVIGGLKPEMKWPNDILLGSKKVCGILLESSFDGDRLNHIVIGIGLNVNQTAFPEEIASRATSLAVFAGRKFDREEIFMSVLNGFSRTYDEIKKGNFHSVMKKWRDRSHMFGRSIRLKIADRTVDGVFEDVAEDGALIIRTSSGVQKFTAGEITISEYFSTGRGETI